VKFFLMMETASTSETSANFHQTTRRNNPEDSNLHTRRRENLKSHSDYLIPSKMFSDFLQGSENWGYGCRWKDNIKIDVIGNECENEHWIQMT
jgi:hypothetical protein